MTSAGAESAETAAARTPDPPPTRTPRRWVRALRPLPLLLVVGWLAHRSSADSASAEPDRALALAAALSEQGLQTEPEDVHFIDLPPGTLPSRIERPRALVRAKRDGEPLDVHLVETKLTPEGRLLEIAATYNLSDTSAVDEEHLIVAGQRAAWTIGGAGKTYIVQYLDLAGDPLPEDPQWTRTKKWQEQLTNLQKTGSMDGVRRRTFKLEPAAEKVRLELSDVALHVDSDDREIRIPTNGEGSIVGARFIQEQARHRAIPGNVVTWAVDRVRQSPWVTTDQMQYVKMVGFWGLDWVNRFVGTVTGDDGAEDIQEEFGAVATTPPVEYTDPETGWPPPPLEPVLKKPLEDEGKWRLLGGDDPYVRQNPGAPAPFAMTFVRTDRKRPYTRVYIVLWDPRQVQLHTMSGTLEPKTATGETGPGLVPRKPEVVSRLLAGFNGGFQATHGEYGMGAEGVVYLPPKPYGATVAKMADGSTGFGTWPQDDTVPDTVVGYRQNMTPIVQDGKFNPYKRNWWGGVPPGWKDESRTVRSGICLTKEGFVGYLYGAGIDFEHLTHAVNAARCDYAIHLDMNAGHTGLEFYRVAKSGELPKTERPLDRKWEATGKVRDMEGWEFMGRRMVKYMGLMNFPRYIDREARDFMYLTLRHILPGEPLAAGKGDEGKWRVKGLPQHGWPYSVATTELRPDSKRAETKVRMLKLDPRTVRAATDAAKGKTVVVWKPAAARGPESFWLAGRELLTGADAPNDRAVRVARGFTSAAEAKNARAAMGIGKTDGMLYYAEIVTAHDAERDGALLLDLLARAGCETRLLLPDPLTPALGGDRDLADSPARVEDGLRLIRADAIGAKRIFKDTPVVEPMEWYPLQSKRIRYFRKKKKKAEATDEGSSADATSN